MRRLAIAATAALVCQAAASQGLLQCADPDVLDGLVFTGLNGTAGGQQVRPDMQAEMAALPRPPELIWIARGDVPGTTTNAFRSSLRPDVALDRALEHLERDGWQVQQSGPSLVSQVFIAGPRHYHGLACRAGQQIALSSREVEGESYVNYRISPSGLSAQCGGTTAQGALPLQALAPATANAVPNLRYPVDPATGRPAVARSSGSGGDTRSRFVSSDVHVATPIAVLADSLATQLIEQGWQADARWAGSVTAGSTWSRVDDGQTLLGQLEVLEKAPSAFNVTMRVTALDEEVIR